MSLKKQIRDSIGPFAAPDVIHNAPGLPKTRSGKRHLFCSVPSSLSVPSFFSFPFFLFPCFQSPPSPALSTPPPSPALLPYGLFILFAIGVLMFFCFFAVRGVDVWVWHRKNYAPNSSKNCVTRGEPARGHFHSGRTFNCAGVLRLLHSLTYI